MGFFKRLLGLETPAKKQKTTKRATKQEAPLQIPAATQALIVSMVAEGMSYRDICSLYPDLDPAQIRRTIQRALKKTPMFFDN